MKKFIISFVFSFFFIGMLLVGAEMDCGDVSFATVVAEEGMGLLPFITVFSLVMGVISLFIKN